MSDKPKGPGDQVPDKTKPEPLSENDLDHVAGGLSPAGSNSFTFQLGQKIADKHFPKVTGLPGGLEGLNLDKH